MNRLYEQLLPYLERNHAYQTALALLSWDTETLAPPAAAEYTAKSVGVLSEEAYRILVCDEVCDLLKKLSLKKEQETLSLQERAVVRCLRKEYDRISCIPQKEYREFSEFCATAQTIYCRAKLADRFEDFAPVLEKMAEYTRRFASYRAKKKGNLYDILLNDYEEGFTAEVLDSFFEQLQKSLVPLLHKITDRAGDVSAPARARSASGKAGTIPHTGLDTKKDGMDKSYSCRVFPVEKQRGFCRFLAGYVGFDFNRGVLAESEHPFTTSLHNHDVRLTNHFRERNLESAIFSVIHETGHALYEMGVDDALTGTPAGAGVSMGMHESQSRFYENMIGRSKAFWEPLFPKLKDAFPEELADVSLEHFLSGINRVEPGLIRVEADELTYPLHIMIRYELEKQLFSGDCTVQDLPELWNQKYKETLGIAPETYAEGILQDIHWAMGSFGYFPSYAIGSAVAAQIYAYLKGQMPLEGYLRDGNLVPVREFLRDHVHKYGSIYTTNELLKQMTGEEFNPDYYIRYLTEKYTSIYHI